MGAFGASVRFVSSGNFHLEDIYYDIYYDISSFVFSLNKPDNVHVSHAWFSLQ